MCVKEEQANYFWMQETCCGILWRELEQSGDEVLLVRLECRVVYVNLTILGYLVFLLAFPSFT
jgi:hypothetical protein